MPAIAIQTRRAIDALLSIGLARREFSCSCPFDKKVGGYGDVRIVILGGFDAVKKCEDNAHVLTAAGYNVQVYYAATNPARPCSVTITECYSGTPTATRRKYHAEGGQTDEPIPAPAPVTAPNATAAAVCEKATAPREGFFFVVEKTEETPDFQQVRELDPADGRVVAAVFYPQASGVKSWDAYDTGRAALLEALPGLASALLPAGYKFGFVTGCKVKKGARFPLDNHVRPDLYPASPTLYAEINPATGRLTPVALT